MSTLDVVDQAGGTPANFLDVGGGAQADEIVTALEVHPLRRQGARRSCSTSSAASRAATRSRSGILTALDQLDVDVPIVVRLDGTDDEEGRKILADAARRT